MIDLTQEEIQILRKLIYTAPVQGNLQTLPSLLKLLAGILEKLEKVQHEPDKDG